MKNRKCFLRATQVMFCATALLTLALCQTPDPAESTRPHFPSVPNLPDVDENVGAPPPRSAPLLKLPQADEASNESSAEYSSSKDHGLLHHRTILLTDENWKPLTTKQKFKSTSDDLLNPFTQMSLLANAKFSQAINDRPYLGPNAAGYFRRYGLDTADTANVDFMQGSLLPWLFHEDPRYIPLDFGSRRRRAFYAVTRVLITRKDSGRDGLYKSKLLGAFASSALSNAYYPDERNNGWRATSIRAVSNIGSDAAMNLLKEFWPDVAHKVKLNVWITTLVERSLRTTFSSGSQ